MSECAFIDQFHFSIISSKPDENLPACNECGKDLASLEDYFGETVDKLIREVPPIAHDLKVNSHHPASSPSPRKKRSSMLGA